MTTPTTRAPTPPLAQTGSVSNPLPPQPVSQSAGALPTVAAGGLASVHVSSIAPAPTGSRSSPWEEHVGGSGSTKSSRPPRPSPSSGSPHLRRRSPDNGASTHAHSIGNGSGGGSGTLPATVTGLFSPAASGLDAAVADAALQLGSRSGPATALEIASSVASGSKPVSQPVKPSHEAAPAAEEHVGHKIGRAIGWTLLGLFLASAVGIAVTYALRDKVPTCGKLWDGIVKTCADCKRWFEGVGAWFKEVFTA